MLKPCPFCGGEGEAGWKLENTTVDFYVIVCMSCDAQTGGDRTPEMAVQTWNRRVQEKKEGD